MYLREVWENHRTTVPARRQAMDGIVICSSQASQCQPGNDNGKQSFTLDRCLGTTHPILR